MSVEHRLKILEAEVRNCMKCGLHETRKHTVFGRGSTAAAIMFVGEAPGATEDEEGRPFVGEAGRLLDRMIAAMHIGGDYYICNVVKCRPPNNRTPTDYELEACRLFLDAQINLIRPKIIVALGKTVVRALHLPLPDKGWRGTWSWCTTEGVDPVRAWVMATYHPAYLLRNKNKAIHVWRDLKAVKTKYEEVATRFDFDGP